jgi:hypothetical protein
MKIIGNSFGHNLNLAKFPKYLDFMCTTCAIEKLILRPSPVKIKVKPLKFLEQIQGDICGSIKSLSGPFIYFMVLIDASTRWSHVCLLSTRNHAFAKVMHFPLCLVCGNAPSIFHLRKFGCAVYAPISPP